MCPLFFVYLLPYWGSRDFWLIVPLFWTTINVQSTVDWTLIVPQLYRWCSIFPCLSCDQPVTIYFLTSTWILNLFRLKIHTIVMPKMCLYTYESHSVGLDINACHSISILVAYGITLETSFIFLSYTRSGLFKFSIHSYRWIWLENSTYLFRYGLVRSGTLSWLTLFLMSHLRVNLFMLKPIHRTENIILYSQILIQSTVLSSMIDAGYILNTYAYALDCWQSLGPAETQMT